MNGAFKVLEINGSGRELIRICHLKVLKFQVIGFYKLTLKHQINNY